VMTPPKKKLTHEASARRELVPEVDTQFMEQLRWNADRTALEAVYERRSVSAAVVENV
jgi:hypothetical protein